ncbi:MAG: LutB/LldF family L-lactate oxidation iron-sulfur protein [Bacteroidetes bacterium]|nr:LutB/LldF family L-lactate oxidation iron-sulfur protein [Bacteroidota bacterium]
MANLREKFLSDSEKKAFDPEHRRRLDYNIGKYDEAVVRGKLQFKDLELAKRRAANLKFKVIENLDRYLTEFETNFEKRGGKVIWATNEKEAQRELLRIVKKANAQIIVKQKTMLSEELEINDLLQKHKREVLETDLGEFIVQIAHEKPYHIVTPAMHKSKEDVALLFNEKFGMPADSKPEAIAAFVREHLRSKFIKADLGITGGNFLIADMGAVALTENEGNGLLTLSWPKIHVAIVGIEKIIPSIDDLDLFLPLLATHGTGQNITVYNNILFGPKTAGEPDGPEEMYVILIDNGRTELLEHKEQRRALSCIRCGACLNECPVYRSIGGYSYGVVYSGPIGSVISPHFMGMKDYNHLSYASSLCGRCTEVCSMNIPLHELLLYNRNETVKLKYSSFTWRFIMKSWKKVMLHRWMLDKTGQGMKNRFLKMFFRKSWGPRREIPKVAPKNFKQLWNEKKKLN